MSVACPRCGWRRARSWRRDEVLALVGDRVLDDVLRAEASAWLRRPAVEHHRGEYAAVLWRIARGMTSTLRLGSTPWAYAPSRRVRACTTAIRVTLAGEFCGAPLVSMTVSYADDPARIDAANARVARIELEDDVLAAAVSRLLGAFALG